jgi:uncharacterized membrane protein
MADTQGKSALGMDGNVTALIGYLIWVIALVLVFIEKDNKFVRFHALQAVFWGIATMFGAFVLYILGIIIMFGGSIVGVIIDAAIGVPVVTLIVWLLAILVFLLAVGLILGGFVGVIFAAIKSFNGVIFKLPIIGRWAEKYSGLS